MFRALPCPSSGARDYDVDYHIGRFVLGLLYVGRLGAVWLEECSGGRREFEPGSRAHLQPNRT